MKNTVVITKPQIDYLKRHKDNTIKDIANKFNKTFKTDYSNKFIKQTMIENSIDYGVKKIRENTDEEKRKLIREMLVIAKRICDY